MRWAPAVLLAALIFAGCSNGSSTPEAAPPDSSGMPKDSPATPPPSTESAGTWQGEAGDVRLTLDLKSDGSVDWTEETAEDKKTWSGKWRDEGGELYVLLSKPSNRNALFIKKDETWVEATIDDKEALKGAELVLKRV